MEILDASALIAFIKKEKGYGEIEKLFLDAEKMNNSLFIHQINFIEFIYKMRQIFSLNEFDRIIADLQTPLLGVMNYMDTDLAFYAGHLKSEYHLSLADSMGLACSKIMKGRFWTADKALSPIAKKESIDITLFR